MRLLSAQSCNAYSTYPELGLKGIPCMHGITAWCKSLCCKCFEAATAFGLDEKACPDEECWTIAIAQVAALTYARQSSNEAEETCHAAEHLHISPCAPVQSSYIENPINLLTVESVQDTFKHTPSPLFPFAFFLPLFVASVRARSCMPVALALSSLTSRWTSLAPFLSASTKFVGCTAHTCRTDHLQAIFGNTTE